MDLVINSISAVQLIRGHPKVISIFECYLILVVLETCKVDASTILTLMNYLLGQNITVYLNLWKWSIFKNTISGVCAGVSK